MEHNRILNLYDWFLIAGVTISNLTYSLISVYTKGDTFDILGFIAGVTGVLCVVLCAKRSIYNYFFGLINVSLYAYISYRSGIYGDFALNAVYYFPMQFVGIYLWKKHREEDAPQTVESKRMSNGNRCWLFIFSFAATMITGYLLSRFTPDPMPYKDSATTVLSVIAMFLMVRAYMEQWFLWIVTNVIGIVIWFILALDGERSAGLMVIMWVFYLLNSINGYLVWRKGALESKETK